MNHTDPTTDTPAPDLTAGWVLGRHWMLRAPCAYSQNPDAWFPDDDATPDAIAAATSVCRLRCPVWEECAAYAVATEQTGGIAAGVLLGFDPRANAEILRAELAGADLKPDLIEVLDRTAMAREARSNRSRLAAPKRLSELLTEYPVTARPGEHGVSVPSRECA